MAPHAPVMTRERIQGWGRVVMASLVMSATLPGRTEGLGLALEPLVEEFSIARGDFTRYNLVATLLGALFCVPIGRLVDRYGVRLILTMSLAVLAVAVFVFSGATGAVTLLVGLTLVRGMGQSGLSVVSVAVISKWFSRGLGVAMGCFAVLVTVGFISSIMLLGEGVEQLGWRAAWRWAGLAILMAVPLAWLVVRDRRRPVEGAPAGFDSARAADGLTLRQSLATPAFWALALGTSAFNLAFSGLMLLNESILAERGFSSESAVRFLATLTACGLAANLIGGALATRQRVAPLLGVGLAVFAVALGLLPRIETAGQLDALAAAVGLTGGVVTVVFFAAWRRVFGHAHAGRIQGAAQAATVLASACGPMILSDANDYAGSFAPAFYVLAGVCATLAVAALCVPLPSQRPATESCAAQAVEA